MGDVVATDLEGTLTTGATWRATGRWLEATGRRGAYRRFLVPRLPLVPLARSGLIDAQAFRERWMRDLTRLLAGMDDGALADFAGWVVERELWPARRPSVLGELESERVRGRRVVIASGTYQPVADAFAGRVGAVELGTQLEVSGGRATGRLAGAIGTRGSKAEAVRAAAGSDRIARAYGDTEADIPMLELADEAVAVAPDEALRRVAVARGWRIIEA
jgi:phosphoserine phosphatase